MPSRIGRKRTVTYNGRTYKIRSDKIEIPDLAAMNEFAALTWLIQHSSSTTCSLCAFAHWLECPK